MKRLSDLNSWVFVLIVPVCFFSCVSGSELHFAEEKNVRFEVLNDTLSFGLPVELCADTSKLYISDFYGDKLLYEYDVKNASLQNFGYKGNGPGEFQPPVLLSLTDTALFVYDKGDFSCGYFAVKDPAKRFIPICRLPSSLSALIPIDCDRMLASGFFEQGRYAVLNRKGEIETYFGVYPGFMLRDREAPASAKAMFHQVSFVRHPAERKIASLSRYVLEIIDCAETPEVMVSLKLHDYDYQYRMGQVVYAKRTPETPAGGVAVAASERYIYVVFKPLSTPEQPLCEIWVFDWEGRPVEKWHLNAGIDLLTYAGGTLYGLDTSEEAGGLYYFSDDLPR